MAAQPVLLEEALDEIPDPLREIEHACRVASKNGPAPRRFTRDEYYLMADAGVFAPDERVELIQGEIIEMAPPGPEHASLTGHWHDVLAAAFGAGYCVRNQTPLALGRASDPEPDIAVVPGSWQDYTRAHPTTAVLVVEVSQSSLAYDRLAKGSLYAAAGIPEYWIANLDQGLLEVYREPSTDSAAPFGASYAHATRHGREATVTPLAAPGASLRVDDLLPPVSADE